MEEKNRTFKIALSCSLIWHFLGVQLVTVVWPMPQLVPHYATVNFWGHLLDTAAGSADKPAIPGIAGKEKDTQIVTFKKNESGQKKFDEPAIPGKENLPLSELSKKASPEPKAKGLETKQFVVIEDIASAPKRSIMYKPELPACPDWAGDSTGNFELKLKFLILPDGSVGKVEKLISSGYPELDEIGMRYMRKWHFIALPKNAAKNEQWGEIKLIFKLP
ncbi:MAG: TonB family protein [Candidatus Omnitrophota bacterium]